MRAESLGELEADVVISQPTTPSVEAGPQTAAHQAASENQPGLATNAAGAAGALAGWAFASVSKKVRVSELGACGLCADGLNSRLSSLQQISKRPSIEYHPHHRHRTGTATALSMEVGQHNSLPLPRPIDRPRKAVYPSQLQPLSPYLAGLGWTTRRRRTGEGT